MLTVAVLPQEIKSLDMVYSFEIHRKKPYRLKSVQDPSSTIWQITPRYERIAFPHQIAASGESVVRKNQFPSLS